MLLYGCEFKKTFFKSQEMNFLNSEDLKPCRLPTAAVNWNLTLKSFLGAKVPERKLEVPCNFHSELSLPGTFVLWNFRSQECSLQELLFPETVREKVIWILQQTNYPSFFRVTCMPKHFGDINIANDARYHNIDVQKMLNRIWNVFNNIKKEPLHSDVKTRKG